MMDATPQSGVEAHRLSKRSLSRLYCVLLRLVGWLVGVGVVVCCCVLLRVVAVAIVAVVIICLFVCVFGVCLCVFVCVCVCLCVCVCEFVCLCLCVFVFVSLLLLTALTRWSWLTCAAEKQVVLYTDMPTNGAFHLHHWRASARRVLRRCGLRRRVPVAGTSGLLRQPASPCCEVLCPALLA